MRDQVLVLICDEFFLDGVEGDDILSKIVVKDEAKSQDYIIFLSYFDTVDANDGLSVSQ